MGVSKKILEKYDYFLDFCGRIRQFEGLLLALVKLAEGFVSFLKKLEFSFEISNKIEPFPRNSSQSPPI